MRIIDQFSLLEKLLVEVVNVTTALLYHNIQRLYKLEMRFLLNKLITSK